MSTATLERMKEAIARLDKACGQSFIPDNHNCGKTLAQGGKDGASNSNVPQGSLEHRLSKNLTTAAGLATMAVVLGVVGKAAQEIKSSGLPDDFITPRRPPKGYYDTFTPGDLLYTTFDDALSGVTRAHYAVYLGKDEDGKHTIAHANTKEGEKGEVLGSHVVRQSIDEYGPDRSFKKAARTEGAGKQPTTEQLHKIIEEINGKDFAWDGFKDNCESFARAVVNDLPISTQSEKINPLTKELVAGIMKIAFPGLGKKGQLRGKDIKEVAKRVVGDGLYVDVTSDVFPILRSVYGAGIQKVLSAQLDGENIVGIFRGSPRPGESRYYNYTLSTEGGKASVRYKQSVRGDAADKPCDCEECKEKNRMKSECGCKSDSITKTHAVMREFKQGNLKSSSGDKVTDRKQAIAIAISEEERMKRRKKKSDSGDSLVARLRAAIATLDAKCGKGGISQGESCHIGSGDKSIHEAIGMGASVLSGGSLDKLVMQKHGVDQNTAREFSQSLGAVFRQGGGMAARKHYEAWSRHIVKTAKTVA